MNERSQGSTEYLLILAVVLIVAAMALFFLLSFNPRAIITGSAENSGDNIVFTPSNTLTPENIPASNWEWALFTAQGSMLVDYTYPGAAGYSPDTGTNLARGVPITFGAEGIDLGTTGDKLKIRYRGKDIFESELF